MILFLKLTIIGRPFNSRTCPLHVSCVHPSAAIKQVPVLAKAARIATSQIAQTHLGDSAAALLQVLWLALKSLRNSAGALCRTL